MAEYQLELKTNADASALEELIEKLQSMVQLEEETGEYVIAPDADPSALDDVANSLFEVKEAEDEAEKSSEELGDSMKKTQEDVDGLGNKSEESADQVGILGDAMMAIGALGLAAEFQNTATAADNYNVSMAALNTVAQNNGVSMDNVSSSIKKVTDATTISGGQARSFFSLMMNMGVTNTNALADSLVYLQGQSAITGSSVEQMESKMTRLANSDSLGSRQLVGLGLSLNQLAEANGTTTEQISSDWANMTADERIEALNNAMKENSGLVEEMNNTTSAQLTELGQTWAGIEIEVGQSTTGINQAVLGLANEGLKGLKQAITDVPLASELAGAAMAAGSLVMSVDPALKTFNNLSMAVKNTADTFRGLKDVATGLPETLSSMKSALTGVATTAKSAAIATLDLGKKTLLAGANAVKAAGMWLAEKIQLAASAIAKGAAAVASYALAIAEWLLASPLLLIVIIIVAVIAVLWYLYNTNESVRAGIDTLVQAFWNFIAYIQTIPAQVMAFVTSVISYFNQLYARIRAALIRVVSAIISTIANWASAGASAASGVVSRIVGAFSGIQSRISSALSGVVNTITKPFRDAYNTAKGLWDSITSLGSAGISVGSAGIVSGSAGISLGDVGSSNRNLVSNITNSNRTGGSVNINMSGIIEKSASEFIVDSINDELQKQRVIRGI
jgi:phage-related protein